MKGKLNCCRLIPFLSPDAMVFSFCYAVFSVFTFFSFLPVFDCFQAYFGHLSTKLSTPKNSCLVCLLLS